MFWRCCGTSRTIRSCWEQWSVSNFPGSAAPVTFPGENVGVGGEVVIVQKLGFQWKEQYLWTISKIFLKSKINRIKITLQWTCVFLLPCQWRCLRNVVCCHWFSRYFCHYCRLKRMRWWVLLSMLNVEFVSLVWILNHPRNVVVALTLYQNVMVVLEKKKSLFLGIICSFAFHFKHSFLLDSFLCVFCQYFEKS